MRRAAPLLLLSCALASGAAACADASDPGVVNDDDPLTSENGLSSNGLSSNGLSSNGLTSNALSSNALSSNALSSNALVIQALRNQSATGDLARMFFRYLISCALGPNHSVSYTWTDSSGTKHTEVNPGGLGLAPGWESGAPTQTDKEVISACLAARTNSKGIPVPLSLRGKSISGLSVTSAERSSYTYGEGAFWGNIFNGINPPALYSCSRVAFNAGVSTSQYLAQGRTCTTAGCGIITPVGACYTSDSASSGQACFDRDSGKDWVSECDSQKKSYVTATSNVLTTWLLP
jgi:GLTT repeat (6 copies)